MPRGGKRGGGINLRSLAIREIKSRLTIDVVTASGLRVLAPGQSFDEISSALVQLAAVKKLGTPNIRYLRKKLMVAREFFKKPSQQLHLNEISVLVDRAEEACQTRVQRRRDKKMLRNIVNSKKSAPAAASASAAAPAPAPSPVAMWEKMLQEQKEKDHGTPGQE
jgi:hypothetical protein